MGLQTAFLNKVFAIVTFLSAFIFVALAFWGCGVSALETTSVGTAFSSSYSVDGENTARVTTSVIFRNTGEYPTVLRTYDLFVGAVEPVDVSAHDDTGDLPVELIETNGTAVRVTMNETLLRVDETHTLTISYELEPFFTQNGGAYDVLIPAFSIGESSSFESLSVDYDELFGQVNYVGSDCTVEYRESRYHLSCTPRPSARSIQLSVGEQRWFSFLLERSFDNPSDQYDRQTVMLPPDLLTQQMILTAVSVFPSDVQSEHDGDYVLTMDIPAGETLWARFQGILIEKLPYTHRPLLSQTDREYFLRTDAQWFAITDTKILSDVEALAGDHSEDETVRAIYDYTLSELVLNEGFRNLHSAENRKGAETAIKTYKNASAEDYADVFAALCRYAGIPSRIVAGYLFPMDDVSVSMGMFHVWPQFWSSERGWVSVDPAYEAYSGLPFFEFAGLNRVIISTAYESGFTGYPETTDEITMTDLSVAPVADLQVDMAIDSSLHAGEAGGGVLRVTNGGNTILRDLHVVQTDTSDLIISLSTSQARTSIMPGETVEIPFSIAPLEWFVTGERDLSFVAVAEASAGTQRVTIEEVIDVEPLWWVEPLSWLITVIAFGVFVVSVWSGAKIGSLIVRFFTKKKEMPDILGGETSHE
ncbi:MAG: transglutaminase-like domain-containing protein [Candidatus Dojkabacteria bacterium]|nr:transglutaminase-like domain-containing protein [Candidatus Dojkabacteria bacterium]